MGDPSGHFVAAEANFFRQRGAHVTVVHPRSNLFRFPGVLANLRAQPLLAASFPVCALRLAHDLWAARGEVLSSGSNWDRVVAHWSVPMGFFALSFDCPIELVSHGQDVRLLLGLPKTLRDALIRMFLRRIEAWRFVSESLRHELLDSLYEDTRALLRTRSYVAAAALELPTDISVQGASVPKTPYWIVMGRLVRSKHVEVAIAHARKQAMPLYVVGDGPERAHLESIADKRLVSFLGTMSHPEALRWLRGAESLLFASSAEGESTVLREAKHFGVRVIDLRATTLPALPS